MTKIAHISLRNVPYFIIKRKIISYNLTQHRLWSYLVYNTMFVNMSYCDRFIRSFSCISVFLKLIKSSFLVVWKLVFQYDKQYTTLAKCGHIAIGQQCRQNKYHTPTQGLSCHQEIISHSNVTGYLQISHMHICSSDIREAAVR